MTIQVEETGFRVAEWDGNVYGNVLREHTLAISAFNGSPALGVVESFSMPYGYTIHDVYADCDTSDPVDPLVIQLTNDGNNLLSTPLTIDATKNNSIESVVQPVLIGAQRWVATTKRIGIEVLSANAAKGVKVTIVYKRLLTISQYY